MEQPQEVEDEEHERVYQRVAAVDVAKASGVVCTPVPDEDRPGRRIMHVWTVGRDDNLAVEMRQLLNKPDVLQQRRTPLARQSQCSGCHRPGRRMMW